MSHVSPVKYFAVVLQPLRPLAVTALLVLGTAGWLAWVDPASVEQATALALLCQMFAAATGYSDRARRGHFDPLLLLGTSRRQVAAAHWVCSVAPGALVWFSLAAFEWWLSPGSRPVPLTAPGLTAWLWVSALAWALALPLSRYASGALWLITLFTLVAAQWTDELRTPFRPVSVEWTATLKQAGAALVNPFLLLINPESARPGTPILVAAAAVIAIAAGVRFIATYDAFLQDPS